MADLLEYLIHEACCPSCEKGKGCETGDKMGRKAFAYELVIGEDEKTMAGSPRAKRVAVQRTRPQTPPAPSLDTPENIASLERAGWIALDPDKQYWTHPRSGEPVSFDVALSKMARHEIKRNLQGIISEMMMLTEISAEDHVRSMLGRDSGPRDFERALYNMATGRTRGHVEAVLDAIDKYAQEVSSGGDEKKIRGWYHLALMKAREFDRAAAPGSDSHS